MKRQTYSDNLKKMTAVAMFAALAYVSVVIIRIPNVGGFLTMDFKDVIITVAGMFFGPISAVVLALIVPLLEFLTISGTGFYGLIMNVLSSMTFALVASIIYKYKKSFLGAVLGLLSAAVATTAIMMVANLLITPYYTGMPTQAVAEMIPKLLLPFNLTKAILNASLTMALYKPLTTLLKKTNLAPRRRAEVKNTAENADKNGLRTALTLVISLLIAVCAIAVILVVWDGDISFFDVFKPKS